jgi:ankyrin repeat protein
MSIKSKIIVLTRMSVLLSVHVQAMMQELQEQSLKKQEQEMVKLFPETRLAQLAVNTLTNPSSSAINEYYRELIFQAISEKNVEKVQTVLEQGLEQGFDVNLKDNLGFTLLGEAVCGGNKVICQLLIDTGADINNRDIEGNTPLLYAALNNNLEIAQQLIKAGADVNIKNKFNKSSLGVAVEFGSMQVVKLLLETPGINIDREELSEALAASKDTIRVTPNVKQDLQKLLAPYLMTLVDLSADTIAKNSDKSFIQDKLSLLPQELQEKISYCLAQRLIDNELLEAIKTRNIPAALVALEQGARVNIQDKNGNTPLYLASGFDAPDSPKLIKALLARGADINKKTNSGNFTPLHEAVMNGSPYVLTLLLENGAQVNAQTRTGYTALDYAVFIHYSEAVKILLHYGGKHGIEFKNYLRRD